MIMDFLKKHLIPMILAIALGIGGTFFMVNNAASEKRADIDVAPLIVEISEAKPKVMTSVIRSTGVVQPSKKVSIIPQVGGLIISIAEGLSAGSRFDEGTILAKIESEDYRYNVIAETSRVAQAELNLSLEEERQSAARREWDVLGHKDEPSELAIRKPQVRVAKANVLAAEANLNRAELNLYRTQIKAPFNGMIQSESIDVGQVVGVGSSVMNFIGTDQFWVRVSIPASRLGDVLIPDVNSEIGSTATVIYKPADGIRVEKEGFVYRLESELDRQTRTAYLLVAIDNPLEGVGIPLLPGAYVDVVLQGRSQQNAVSIPEGALRNGDHVLIADNQNKMARKDVELGWLDGEQAVLLSGVNAGDRIITTAIGFPIYGQDLQIAGE
jgi:RND family efflux transporter MFP subunit